MKSVPYQPVRAAVLALVAGAALGLLAAAPASAALVVVTPLISGSGSITNAPGCQTGAVANGTQTACAVVAAGNPIDSFPGVVVLVAVPRPEPAGHWTFVRWEGCPSPSGTTCTAVVGGPGVAQFTVRAVFEDHTGPAGTPASVTHSTATDRTVTLGYGFNEPVSAVACSVDGGALAACPATAQTLTLAEGTHTFQVRGTDISGNVGALNTATTFRIIDTALVDGPGDFSNATAPTFVFSSLTGLTFECSIDGAAFADCGAKGADNRGSTALSGLGDGEHTFRVRAKDGPEFDRVPTVRTWTVDTVPPAATLDLASGPGEGALQAVTKETFRFAASEPSTFQCRLDGAAFAACAPGVTFDRLKPGRHRFEVRAIDRAGNVGAVAARSWTVARPDQIVVTLAYFANAKKKTTKFSSLQVRNIPSGTTVTVTCKGKGCPKGLTGKGYVKRRASGTLSLAKFIKRPLRAGIVLTVVASRTDSIAAVKVLTVRASKKPLIATKCRPPGTKRAVAC